MATGTGPKFSSEVIMLKFTVLGVYEESGQIFSHFVKADNSSTAMAVVAKHFDDALIHCAIDGYLCENRGISFAGESQVESATILDQPEVFGSPDHGVLDISDSEVDLTESLSYELDFNGLEQPKKVRLLSCLIGELLDSAALASEYKDCLSEFSNYNWVCRVGADTNRFSQLKQLGNNHDLDNEGLDEFMDLVSDKGEYHLYFVIRKAFSYSMAANTTK